MKIKQLIDTPSGISASFHIDEDGSLIIEMDGNLIEVPYQTATELVEYLRNKLIDHHNANSSILKQFFR